MGDGSTDHDATEPPIDAPTVDGDAPWRPGFDGWTMFDADQNGHDARPITPSVAADPRWSREHDLAEPEPWVPQRSARRRAPQATQAPSRPAAEVVGQPTSSVLGSLVLGAIAVVGTVVAALVIAVALRPASPAEPEQLLAPIVPVAPIELWTIDIDGEIDATAAGADAIVVHSEEADTLVGYDRATGVELWAGPAVQSDRGIEQLQLIDDVVVVQWRGQTGVTHVDAIDALTGERLWSSAPSSAVTSVGRTQTENVIMQRFRADDRNMLAVIDPRSGEALHEAVALSEVTVPGAFVGAVPADGQVFAWSLQDREPATPAIDSFNVRSIASLGDVTVGLDREGRILAFDEQGVRIDERKFASEAFGEFTSRAGLAGSVEHANVGLISSGSSLAFTVTDGRIETLWQQLGRVFEPVITEAGAVSLLLGPTGETGEVNESIIDSVTGETIAVTDDGTTREQPPTLGHNAFVVSPEIGDPDRRLAAFDYGGQLMWELPITSGSRYAMQDGLIVLIDRVDGRSTVTVMG